MKPLQINSKNHDNTLRSQDRNFPSAVSKFVSQPADAPNPSYRASQRPHKLVPPSPAPYRNISLSYHVSPVLPTLPSVQTLLAIADNPNAPPPTISALNSPHSIGKPEEREYLWLSATYGLPRTTHPSMSIRFDYTMPLSAECTSMTAMAANHDTHVPLADPDALVWLQSRPGICQVRYFLRKIKQFIEPMGGMHQDYAKGSYIQLKINWYGYRAFFVDCPINVKTMTRRGLLRAIATSLFLFRNSGAQDYKPYIPDESHLMESLNARLAQDGVDGLHIGTVVIKGLVYNQRCGSWIPEIVHPVVDLV